MKQKELQKQLERIAKKVEKKEIVKKAEEVARKHGDYKSEVYPYRIKVHYRFSGKDYVGGEIDIKGSSGWSDFGGEDQEIFYNRKRVFYVSTSPAYTDFGTPQVKEQPNQVKMGELYLHEYSPGQWETQLNRIYKNGPKKEKPKVVKPEESEVEKSKLEELAARLPLKI